LNRRVPQTTVDGFVDHHAHLLRVASGDPPPWGSPDGIRAYHERCAERGVSPVDDPEPPSATDLPSRLDRGLRTAASNGICELWEAGLRDWAYLDALLELRERGPLPVRVRLLVAAGLAESGLRPRLGDTWVELVGLKFYADGWLGPRTCAVSHGFCDEPHNKGIAFESADSLARRVAPFAAAGWQIATHAIGDRAIEAVLDAYEQVYGTDCATAAPRIEHAQVLRSDLVERMAHLGVVACIQPGFATDDHATAARGLGEEWPDAYRWSVLLDAGVRIVCGSDYPIDGLAPLQGLAKLVANPFDPMDVTTALALMTSADAGTTVLAEDPLAVEQAHLGTIGVVATHPAAA
jgi:predicted amidohydrolase YtcJ